MKIHHYLVLFFILTFTSCSIENNEPIPRTEFMAIESVEVPDHFVQGETYEIFMSYFRPTSCYVFNNFIFDVNGQERAVSILNTIYDRTDCIDEGELTTVSFDFTVSGDSIYLFKFYQGKDEQGTDQYHIVEIPVINDRTTVSNTQN